MYDRGSSKVSVNALCKHLFTKKGRTMEGLPPTEAFQIGYCWFQSLSAQQKLSSPCEWGWTTDDSDEWKLL